jgi:hypothetical protein
VRDDADAAFRPAAALAFWCCLAVAAALFAAVELSPKLRTYRELRHEYDALETKLTVEERQVQHLESVADALRNDPEFAAELARVDFGTDESEERIPVDPKLNLEDGSRFDNAAGQRVAKTDPLGILQTPLLDKLCDSRLLRRSLLAAAVLLLLVGFVLFSGDARRLGHADLSARCRQWLAGRYGKRGL